MKLISTLVVTDQLEITMMIQSRNQSARGSGSKQTSTPLDAALISKYVSKVGNESLIFNPTVATMVRSRQGGDGAYIPLSLFYRFTGNLSAVYESLSNGKLYHIEESALYVDKKQAMEHAKRLPLFRNTLTLIPDVYIDRSNTFSKGIAFLVDGKSIGVVNHQEALGIIEQLDHLDITSYSLMAGVIDELENANRQLETMTSLLQKIYTIVQRSQAPLPPPAVEQKSTSPIDSFSWGSTIDWRPM